MKQKQPSRFTTGDRIRDHQGVYTVLHAYLNGEYCCSYNSDSGKYDKERMTVPEDYLVRVKKFTRQC